jgi:hypothetical protein
MEATETDEEEVLMGGSVVDLIKGWLDGSGRLRKGFDTLCVVPKWKSPSTPNPRSWNPQRPNGFVLRSTVH